MESERFDRLARLVSTAASRRSALRGLAKGALGGIGLASASALLDEETAYAKKCNGNAQCRNPNNPCKKGVCKHGRCRKKNKRNGKNCGNGRVCQNGRCVSGCESTGSTCTAGNECCSGICTCDGGKENNPETSECHGDSFVQDFESNIDGWFDWDNAGDTWPGTQNLIERVPSGTNDIPSNGGSFHAEILPGISTNSDTAMTLWGGYSTAFPDGGFVTRLDIYLDPEAGDPGTHFDYSSAINRSDNCLFLNEAMFHGGINDAGTAFCVSAGGGTGVDPCDPEFDAVEIPVAEKGWYTFRHKFRIVGGKSDVKMELLRGNDIVEVWRDTGPEGPVGGNRYGWFPVNQFPFLAIDNSERSS